MVGEIELVGQGSLSNEGFGLRVTEEVCEGLEIWHRECWQEIVGEGEALEISFVNE